MPAPSPLSIAISSVTRLVREEASYHAELAEQEARLRKTLENPDPDDDNVEFTLNQERRAIEETRAVFPSLKNRIADAVQNLQDQLENGADASPREAENAREVLATVKERSL